MPVATVGTPIAFCTFVKIGREGGSFWDIKEMHFKAKKQQGDHLASPGKDNALISVPSLFTCLTEDPQLVKCFF